MTLYLEGAIELLWLSFFGVGIFLGGFIAYCDPKIKEGIAIAVMLIGCFLMLTGILLKDLG